MSCLYSSISSGQTLTDQIEHAYSSLDSVSYIDEIILSYIKRKEKELQESFRSFVRMMSKDKDEPCENHMAKDLDGAFRRVRLCLSQLVAVGIAHW